VDISIDLTRETLVTNSDLWTVVKLVGEDALQVVGNESIDQVGGKVALIGEARRNYSMRAEMKFLGHHLEDRDGGWFGFVVRAQDVSNYELVWFMPHMGKGKTAAYLSVAYGVVPWWTEGYAIQEKGGPLITKNKWFETRIEVVDDELSVFVEGEFVFTKKLTYYLSEGRPGFYVGTATDAAFRRVEIKDLP